MKVLPRVTYLSKKDNPPNYYAGKELHTVEFDRGWVEYLLETSDLYFVRLDDGLLDQFRHNAWDYIQNIWQDQSVKHFSLLNQLANIRIKQPFDLPLFVDLRAGPVFTCGCTRFVAEILCGSQADQIPVFFQTAKGVRPPELETAIAVTTTHQAEEISGMDQCEFIMNMSQSLTPTVIGTVLRNTIYEADSDYSTFEEQGHFIVNFWKKFTHDNRINLTITCNPNVRSLIHYHENFWNVKFNFSDIHGFSFSEILGKFNEPNPNNELNLFVYDITQPFNLEYLLPWTTTNSVWYHTLNKKINLFDTTRGAATSCWPIVCMGNFVK